MYNRIILMGRITHDLELKTTPQGVSVCSFRIAVDRRYQAKGEERKADFFNIVAWRQQAEFVTKYFGKGRMILVDGELNTRNYTDKNGNPNTWYEIVADRVTFTGEPKPNGGGYGDSFGAPPLPDNPPPYGGGASSQGASGYGGGTGAQSDSQQPGSGGGSPAAAFVDSEDDYPF